MFGGVVGEVNRLQNLHSDNVTVFGEGFYSINVGGIAGLSANSIDRAMVSGLNVISDGNSVGGVSGSFQKRKWGQLSMDQST